jgi:hypothetical protein
VWRKIEEQGQRNFDFVGFDDENRKYDVAGEQGLLRSRVYRLTYILDLHQNGCNQTSCSVPLIKSFQDSSPK